jgi:hypothetical protein
MQDAILACVDIYHPEYTLSEDLGLLNGFSKQGGKNAIQNKPKISNFPSNL